MKRWLTFCLSMLMVLSAGPMVFGAETAEDISGINAEIPEEVTAEMEDSLSMEEEILSAEEEASADEGQIQEIPATDYIPVLMYHHFAQRDMGRGNGVVVTQAELEEQIKYFKEQGYRIISLEELDHLLTRAEMNPKEESGLGLSAKYLCITMDDGYYSNYDLAYPIFRQERVPAAIFAITDSVTNHVGLRKFTWKEAGEMVKNSQVRIYNHTSNHIAADDTDEDSFVAAVLEGQEALESHLAQQRDTVTALAYPNGENTPEIQQRLLEAGVRLQFTVTPGVVNRNTSRTAIPRIMVVSGMTGAEILERASRLAAATME
ncbi:polysaccharide deacetylase family protein [Anaerotignum lactatifermentans]|uniref:Polysaccharide deacetylase family protein n=1 Tax=Anaerotignum lactatifermentans TaxID=160404 RepID=A0ABS2G7I0_9FIRM|nr:polysaccharide deacetylase family protein [Anaerotignum lactatifermentans]MBM6828224.1 polysaccharide deacetylase family protein [Anaerotignum lactatifermentans]MBM6876613.1 polysaccharide deacetylase family protein [Anaerotignum lactatifermentans]MBM6949807.1 polysaccharide deacetylase family protein [Anaerotignum lactatifermentans]